MPRAKPQRRAAGAQVLPVVVGVRDAQVAGVFGGVVVAVADEAGLVVVVEVGVRDGDEVGGVAGVQEAVVVVLVVVEVAEELAVVDPDVCGCLDMLDELFVSEECEGCTCVDSDAVSLGGG